MIDKMLTVIAACLYYSGLVGLKCWWTRQLGPRLIILNYHLAAEGDMRQHLLYLRQNYRLLHLEDALEELFSPLPKKVQDRRTPLVVTFDDGYYDNYTHAFALARELEIPLTIFLIPGYIETGDCFWWQEPERLVAHASVNEVTIEEQQYHLSNEKERKALIQTIDAHVRFASSVHDREAYLRNVRQLLEVPYAVTLEEKGGLPISWVEAEEMNRSEWISFGAHTMHHPILSCLTDPSETEYEVHKSRTQLQQHLESSVRTFAYPIGKHEHIGNQALSSVKKAGYAWAVTTIDSFNTPHTDPHLLCRLAVDVRQHWLVIAVRACGIAKPFTTLIRIVMESLPRLAR